MRGAALMTASMAAFTVNDTFMKTLSDELPLFQAIGLRGLGSTVLLLAFALITRQHVFAVPKGDRLKMFVRMFCEAGAAFCFLGAIFHMEFANASAIGQVAPLVVALAAALWLGERLSPFRILSIVIGFGGVVLMLQPDKDGFNWWSLSVIASVVFVTIRDIVTRQMSHAIPAFTIVIYGAAGVAVAAWTAAAFDEIRPISLKAASQMTGSVLFLILGYFTSILTMRVGEVSFVAPFRYTSMLFALIVGWGVFSQWPNALTLIGAAIVIGAGLLSLTEELRSK
jgi:drug/metabolite transporter (DMT)-like permease